MEISDIPTCAQLACVLEVSAPKPGNVNRYHDFDDTRFEHFLASGVSLWKSTKKAAERGFKSGTGNMRFSEIGIGRLVMDAVIESKKWHTGKNTNLGIAMLLIPLSSAWGASIAMGTENEKVIRKNIDHIIKESTFHDSLALFNTIRIVKPGGMGKVKEYDVFSDRSLREIEENKVNLFQLMELSKDDSIAKELTTSMRISFEIGFPTLMEEYSQLKNINDAIVNTYLKILSEIPDSLIKRKEGAKIAEEVSKKAQRVLEGSLSVHEFDNYLRKSKNRLNPGTTADLVTSSLMISLLRGLRI